MGGDRPKPDNLSRIRRYDPPPEGFDPRTAPQKLLRRHGLPPRPNPKKQPELARLWKQAFARPVRVLKADLAIDPIKSGRKPLLPPPPLDGDTSIWAGAAVLPNSLVGEPAKWVFAQWVVPKLEPIDPAGYQDIEIGIWVGLDGYNHLGDQILQAGIAATVDPDWIVAGVDYWAWTQWVPDKEAHKVENFPVSEGDTVSFLVCAPQPDLGRVTMLNQSSGLLLSFDVLPPAGITSVGASVEWIVEKASVYLPYFYPVTFTSCIAGTEHDIFDLTNSTAFNIVGQGGAFGGNFITETSVTLPNIVEVQWKGFS